MFFSRNMCHNTIAFKKPVYALDGNVSNGLTIFLENGTIPNITLFNCLFQIS